jgi:hypothetical protein
MSTQLDRIKKLPRSVASGILLAGLVGIIPPAVHAQNYESHQITIDASTAQPVGTGFIPANANGEVIILAEGSVQNYPNAGRYDQDWFGPAGMTRMARAGQPIFGGMPYGAVVGGFTTNVPDYRYVGRMGAFHLLPAHVGQEFRLALNMSDADLAALNGQFEITVIYIADGTANTAMLEIKDGTTLPVPTGIFAAAGDRFLVLPYGAIQTTIPFHLFTDGYFDPAGLPKFNRVGQPYSDGPFGGLYGHFDDAAAAFYIGDSGTWMVGTGVAGQELKLNVNLAPADLVGCDGRFVVNVIRIPQ